MLQSEIAVALDNGASYTIEKEMPGPFSEITAFQGNRRSLSLDVA
jgi:hypothetical protein